MKKILSLIPLLLALLSLTGCVVGGGYGGYEYGGPYSYGCAPIIYRPSVYTERFYMGQTWHNYFGGHGGGYGGYGYGGRRR